ncbi:hypothetical protein glysoja_010062 [Glycine soja]|nr:hypothetical protein glysoja_010062 [Glycine soja]
MSCCLSCCASLTCGLCTSTCGLFGVSLVVSWILREVGAPLLEKFPWIGGTSDTYTTEWYQAQAVLSLGVAACFVPHQCEIHALPNQILTVSDIQFGLAEDLIDCLIRIPALEARLGTDS